jgi:hypothetical protein
MDSDGGHGLSTLTNLTFLDFSGNGIGYTDSNGTIALAQGLSTLMNLTSLDLSENNIGYMDSNGTIALAQVLSSLTNLTFLDLSTNNIGTTDSKGAVALGQGLSNMQNLRSLNLGTVGEVEGQENCIGSTGPEGPAAILSALASLPNFDFENLTITSMTNISWTNASSTFQKAKFSTLINACQQSQCFGGGISPSSSTQEALSALGRPRVLIESPSNTTFLGDDKALVLYQEPLPSSHLDTLSTLGTSVMTGMMFAALPEAIGDTLQFSGLVSEKNAFHIKLATNAALVFGTGSWMATGASYLTTTTLQYAGVTESKARIGGNAAAFLVNMGISVTPTKVAATAVNYAAGRLGLWAEKGLMRRMFPRRQNANSSTTLAQ